MRKTERLKSRGFSSFDKAKHGQTKPADSPKRAVVVVKGSEPGAMMLVPENAPMGEVVERLRLWSGDGAGKIAAEELSPSPGGPGGIAV